MLWLQYIGVEDVNLVTGDELNSPYVYLIFLNGLIVGAHPRPLKLVEKVMTADRDILTPTWFCSKNSCDVIYALLLLLLLDGRIFHQNGFHSVDSKNETKWPYWGVCFCLLECGAESCVCGI